MYIKARPGGEVRSVLMRILQVSQGELRLVGELDLSNAESLPSSILPQSAAGNLTLDLSGLSFIDCAGGRALVELADALPGRLVLKDAQRPVLRVVRLMQIPERCSNVELVSSGGPAVSQMRP